MQEAKPQAGDGEQRPPRSGIDADQVGESLFLRAILESSTDYAIIATDLDGRVTQWNEGARLILGWNEAEMLGELAHAFFTSEDVEAGQPEREMEGSRDAGRAVDERWHQRKDGSRLWASGMMMPLRSAADEHIGYLKILRDRTAEREAEEHRKLLVLELQHRVKNTLAMVQAIAGQTFRDAPRATRDAFGARLIALSEAHDILTRANWTAASLRQVIEGALVPHDRDRRFDLDGPDLTLAAKPALALALALHELATNAAKYGALSVEGGEVVVRWAVDGQRFRFTWTERGGPAVSPPNSKGFGSRLIERSLAAEFGGEVAIEYAPTGVVCRIAAPLDAMRDHEPLAASALSADADPFGIDPS